MINARAAAFELRWWWRTESIFVSIHCVASRLLNLHHILLGYAIAGAHHIVFNE